VLLIPHLSLIEWSAGPASVSLPHNHWSSVLKTRICWRICYIGLLDPYLQYMISMFNTWSREPTHRSLTDIGGGYNLRCVGFPYHSLALPNRRSSVSPKGPAGSQVINLTITNWIKNEQILNLTNETPHSTATAFYPLRIASANGKPPYDWVNKGNQEGWS
jgi:hypothetical protein